MPSSPWIPWTMGCALKCPSEIFVFPFIVTIVGKVIMIKALVGCVSVIFKMAVIFYLFRSYFDSIAASSNMRISIEYSFNYFSIQNILQSCNTFISCTSMSNLRECDLQDLFILFKCRFYPDAKNLKQTQCGKL